MSLNSRCEQNMPEGYFSQVNNHGLGNHEIACWSPWSWAVKAMVDDVLFRNVGELIPPDHSAAPFVQQLVAVVLKNGRFEELALDPVEGLGRRVGLVVVLPDWERHQLMQALRYLWRSL